MTKDLDPKDQDAWLEWMKHFGWPKPEPTPDIIEYK